MRSGSSSIVRHDAVPRERVLAAARTWAAELRRRCPEIRRIGYFGSYARGDYVPGSDLDVVIEISDSLAQPIADRAEPYLPDVFPIGMEILVYTSDELRRLRKSGSAFIAGIDQNWQELS